jgi:hypothetical protein
MHHHFQGVGEAGQVIPSRMVSIICSSRRVPSLKWKSETNGGSYADTEEWWAFISPSVYCPFCRFGAAAQRQRSRLSLAAESCPSVADCKTFRQMVKVGDEDVLSASWACFYIGHNPAERDDSPSADEFLLLMDGKASTTNGQKRPAYRKSSPSRLPVCGCHARPEARPSARLASGHRYSDAVSRSKSIARSPAEFPRSLLILIPSKAYFDLREAFRYPNYTWKCLGYV